MVYYIFKQDLVGRAMLGALCHAVQRGVDVRLMVDATGAFSFNNHSLRKLHNCARDAGYMRNAEGQETNLYWGNPERSNIFTGSSPNMKISSHDVGAN